MIKYLLLIICLAPGAICAQHTVTDSKPDSRQDSLVDPRSAQLSEVVITGQYRPQSLKNSVYLVRTISNEQIKLRGASKVQEVLSDQLGVRFSNDLTLGTSDIILMGVSGQRVKILLDGVPLLDRGDTRESLNQVDINSLERIEIVEGPMSVSYGSDALGGVINLITRNGGTRERLVITGRVQEETAGPDYRGFSGTGTHNANARIDWERNGLELSGSFTRNNFGGSAPGWIPKEQFTGSVLAGYRWQNFFIWYRLDGVDETLKNDGAPNPNTGTEIDQHFLTNRWMHQLQGEWRSGQRLSFSGAASYTDYARRTQTTSIDLATGDRRLTLGAGEQDRSAFTGKFLRATAQYQLADKVSLQPGVELNFSNSSGARILGHPQINDYAFFVSSEITLLKNISLRPGARLIRNSVYDAPPVVPSLNSKIALGKTTDLRLAYARGFRAPALRELYFNFFDASHSIRGNERLEAENSDSFNGSVTWQTLLVGKVSVRSSVGGFYNDFSNFITTGYDPANPSVMTYINIDKYRTAGGTFENTIAFKNFQVKAGFSYTGRYNRLQEEDASLPGLTWYPEANSNILWQLKNLKTDLSLYYKYNGSLPAYEVTSASSTPVIRLARREAFHMADFTVNRQFTRAVSLAGGIKNLFNVTTVSNTSVDTGGAHSSGGPVPIGYGRSFFLGLNLQFIKYKSSIN